MVRREPALPPSRLNRRVPRDLEVICLKCLEKDPDRRYPGAGALAEDLNRWLRGEPIHARPVGLATRAAMWCRRHPLPAALTGLLVLAVIIGLAGVTWKWREAALARDESETINDFLVHKLLDQASPRFNPRGAGLTVGELLDRTSASLGGVFEGRPAVEASIRRTLGSTYQALGLYEKAEPHFRRGHRARLPCPRRGRSSDPPRRESPDRLARRGRTIRRGRAALESSSRRLHQVAGREGQDQPRGGIPARRWLLGPSPETRRGREDPATLRPGSARSLGPEDEQTLRSINQLGLLLQDRGKLDEAFALADEYERGVQMHLWGTKHPDNVTAKASLARVRLSQGQLGRGGTPLRTRGGRSRADLRTGTPEDLRREKRVREYPSEERQVDVAARLLEGIWEAARKSRGLDDPETLRAGSRLARFKIDEGTTEEAGRSGRGPSSLRGDTRDQSPDHPGSSGFARSRPSGQGRSRSLPAEPFERAR